MALTRDEMEKALRVIAMWRDKGMPAAACECPACSTASLAIEDRSARPHAEWYHLSCQACGLNETLNVPLGASGLGEIN